MLGIQLLWQAFLILPIFLSLLPGFLSTGVGRAGRCVGVTLIVVALRRRAVVTLYSPFAQLRELKLLDRHCIPTMEVMLLVLWLTIADFRDFLFFLLYVVFIPFRRRDRIHFQEGKELDRDESNRRKTRTKNEQRTLIYFSFSLSFSADRNALHCELHYLTVESAHTTNLFEHLETDSGS